MIALQIKVDTTRTRYQLNMLKRRIEGEVDELSARYADKAIERAKRLMDRDGGGIKYPSLPRRSSAPGEPLVTQSGRTAKSFDKARVRPMVWQLKSKWWVANYNMEARNRPTLVPAVKKERPNFVRAVRMLVKRL